MKKDDFHINESIVSKIKSFLLEGYAVVKPCFILFHDFLLKNKEIIVKFCIPVLIIGLGYYSCTSTQRIIEKNVQSIFAISDEIRAYYTEKSDYWGLNTSALLENNVISEKFIRQQKIILNGGVEVLVGSGIDADTVLPLSQVFDIVIKKLNKAQCISYAEAKISSENLLKLDQITISNSLGEFVFTWGSKQALPIDKYATKDLCVDGDNTLIWSIK